MKCHSSLTAPCNIIEIAISSISYILIIMNISIKNWYNFRTLQLLNHACKIYRASSSGKVLKISCPYMLLNKKTRLFISKGLVPPVFK